MASSTSTHTQMRLYDPSQRRLYINAAERARFGKAAEQEPNAIGNFCLLLMLTGCRISEGLALQAGAIQTEARLITFRTLKRRRADSFREVPAPPELLARLQMQSSSPSRAERSYLWHHNGQPLNRATAYRWIKRVMRGADISGAQACPKGLRHGYGIHAIRSRVPLNMLQKWMGHASMSTTAIYTNAIGEEEQAIAARMWTDDELS